MNRILNRIVTLSKETQNTQTESRQNSELAVTKYKTMQNLRNIFETKTEIHLNNSTADFTGHLNSSEITELPNDCKETSQWFSEEITRLIQLITRPILIIFGSIGNGLTFYIMRRTSLKNVSSCFYMAVLALADTRKYE